MHKRTTNNTAGTNLHKLKLQDLKIASFNLCSKIKVHSSVAHSAVKVMSAASEMLFKYTKWLETPGSRLDLLSVYDNNYYYDHYYYYNTP